MAIVISEREAVLLLEQVLDRVTRGGEDVLIERPHGDAVVLLPLTDYLEMTAALVSATVTDEEDYGPEGAEIFSLDARRRHRDAPGGAAPAHRLAH